MAHPLMARGQDCGRGLSRAQHWTIPVALVFFPPYPPGSLSAGHFLHYSDSSCWDIHSTLRKKQPQVLLSEPFLVLPVRFPLNSQVAHCDQTDPFSLMEVSWVFVCLVGCFEENIYIKPKREKKKERERRKESGGCSPTSIRTLDLAGERSLCFVLTKLLI